MAGTNIYGELVRAQLQNSAGDLSSPAAGLVYFNTTTGMKWYNGSAWRTAADLSSAQVFTNKDIDGGTASNTSRITMPKNTKANLDALTRKEGTVVYATDQKTIYVDDGVTLTEVSGGGGSSFNISAIAANVATIKKGDIILDTGVELYLAADASLNLLTGVNSAGVTAPAVSTTYYLYFDLAYLPASTTTSTGRVVHVPTTGTSGMYIIKSQVPTAVDLIRFLPLAVLKTDGSGNYTEFENLAKRRHQQPSGLLTPVVETLGPYTIGSVGDVGNIAGGHVLEGTSFPSSILSTAKTWYSLAADPNDDSGNSRTLTENGAPTYAGTGIKGGDGALLLNGSTQYLNRVDTNLNPFESGIVDFSIGCWAKNDNWVTGASQMLFTIAAVAGTVLEVATAAGSTIRWAVRSASTTTSSDIPHGLTGGWHHISLTFTASSNTYKFYIDGVLVGSLVVTTPTTVAGAQLRIGARVNPLERYWPGQVREAFVVKGTALSDADIQKLYSVKLPLVSGVDAANQAWSGSLVNGDFTTELKNFVVDQESDAVYVDIGGPSTGVATLKLADMGLGAAAVPVRKFDRVYTSTPAATIAHGLAGTPTNFAILHDELADGKWGVLDPGSYLKADGTNLYTTGFDLLTIDATHPLRIVAQVGVPAIGTDIGYITKTSAYTAKDGDKIFADTSGGAFTVTLPANPGYGQTVEFYDPSSSWALNNVTVARNGQNIRGAASDFTLDVVDQSVKFVFINASQGWGVY